MPDHDPTSTPDDAEAADTALARLDAWMAASPWHPRLTPFFVYISVFAVIAFLADRALGLYPALYVVQCGVVVWLLWRYRRLIPELNWRFHWLAIPTGVGLCGAWVALGYGYNRLVEGDRALRPLAEDETFGPLAEASPVLFWVTLILRLLGMSIVVPMFEELFTRSAVLRGLSNARKTGIGVIQLLCDLPVIGDWLMHTNWGKRAGVKHGVFVEQFRATAVGKLTFFGVFASTLVFMLNHLPRDYAGCVACGLVWCGLLWWTNRPALPEHKRQGLGPIVWSHGITNAALWAWTLYTGDWQFL
ncbi:MAG: CPBP family intramembrane metalloprotease [Planctomycetes bacterium]|nr:CPBP family intramembrane metalloprotease [Planctomycetota bacterium]